MCSVYKHFYCVKRGSITFVGHSWSLVVIRGHSWSFVVTSGHSWSLVVIRGHSSFVCPFRQDLRILFVERQ